LFSKAADKGGGSEKKDTSECTKPAAFEACQFDSCMIDPCKIEPNVVIIGAGMAGLSAAHRLAQCGFQNFTVLEATDRYTVSCKIESLKTFST